MAISLIDTGTDRAFNGDAVTYTYSPALAQNDLVIAAIVGSSTTDIVMDINGAGSTGGFTVVNELYGNDVTDVNMEVGYKFMGASPDVSFDWGAAEISTDDATMCALMVFRGVDTSAGPFDATSTTATGSNSRKPNSPSISFSSSGVWTVSIGSASLQSEISVSWTAPTNYTTGAIQTVRDDLRGAGIMMGYNSAPTSPEDPGQWEIAEDTDSAWCAVTLALKPSAGVGGGGTTDGFGLPIF